MTDLTKVVSDVESVLVLEQDFSTDALVESELALFAQADDKTIWHLGQYPEVYEDGEIVETPAWVHGVKGAQAGITIRERATSRATRATPGLGAGGRVVGPRPRHQGRRAHLRRGGLLRRGQGHGGVQRRRARRPAAQVLRAPGGVRVGWAGNDPTKETLELVSVEVGPAALAKVRAAALKLEKSAYQHSKDVWGTTAPATTAPALTTPALVGAVGPRATGSIACRPCSRCLPWPRACAGAPPTSSRG